MVLEGNGSYADIANHPDDQSNSHKIHHDSEDDQSSTNSTNGAKDEQKNPFAVNIHK